MANRADIKLTVMWEDEIRKAAALLREAREESDEELARKKMSEAYAACEVALYGVCDDHAVVMIGNKDLHDAVKKSRESRSE
jgi:hypothetical protein